MLRLLAKDQHDTNQNTDAVEAIEGMQLIKEESFVYYEDADGSGQSSSTQAVHDFVPSALAGTMVNCMQVCGLLECQQVVGAWVE